MIIQQLSVFLENKSGRLNEILDILGKANIRIIAATVADTSEYGILRLITSDTAHAIKLLKEDAERHSVVQGAGGGILNDDAVCHRIAERDADFYHIYSVLFECTDYIGCAVERGEAGTKVDRQQVFGAVLEELVDTIHSEFVITDLLLKVTLSAARGCVVSRQFHRFLLPGGIFRCVLHLCFPEPFQSGC